MYWSVLEIQIKCDKRILSRQKKNDLKLLSVELLDFFCVTFNFHLQFSIKMAFQVHCVPEECSIIMYFHIIFGYGNYV